MKNNKYIVFTAMGFELVGLMIAALYLGKKIDESYNLKGLGLIGLSIFALAGWLVHIVSLAKQIERNSNDKDE